MADEPGKSKSQPTDRDARLADALRNNLRRRKPPERKISDRPGLKDAVKNADTEDQDPHG